METCDTVNIDCSLTTNMKKCEDPRKVLYKVEDKPPFAFLFSNTVQILMCQVISVVWLPLSLSPFLCILPADTIRVYLVSTALLSCGVLTSLQSTLGVRLPVVVSVSPLHMAALMSLLQDPTVTPSCPGSGDLYAMGSTLRSAEWQLRLRQLQGALLLCGVMQALLGFSGLQACLCRLLGPVSVAPALILAGLSTITQSGTHTYQSCSPVVMFAMVLFVLGLREVNLPVPTFSLNFGLIAKRYPLFQMFPVFWTSSVVYLTYKLFFAYALETYTNTDLDGFREAIGNSKWFFFPFPFEWGWPVLSLTAAVHLMPAVLLQSVTSMLLMYANADVCELGFPPQSAMSRGLGVEGLGLVFGSLWGHGVATSSANIGLMSFTGMVSRSSVQLAAVMMICMSHFSSLVSIIANIPTHFLFGVQLFLHVGLVLTGISILRFVNFKSSRDSSIVGLSLALGLMVPQWQSQGIYVSTGLSEVDNCIAQGLASPVFVALVLGCLLDLCLPGRTSHHKSHPWRHRGLSDQKTYRLPTWEELLCSVIEQLPFFPSD